MHFDDKKLKRLVSTRFMIGLPGKSLDDDTKKIIRDYGIANFILFERNVESIAQLKSLCHSLHDYCMEVLGHKALIAIDEEGGIVSRFSPDFAHVPCAMAQTASGYSRNAYLSGKIIAKQLAYCGININLAPVADVNSNPQNPIIGIRSYSSEPELAGLMCAEFHRAHDEEGVLCSAKHFPGHGDTTVDSHLDLPRSQKSIDELEKCELVPYSRLIDAGIHSIMISHMLYSNVASDGLPASMSRSIVQDLLRNKLKFQGLIISDCMEMRAISEHFGMEEGLSKAFFAGIDIVLNSHHPQYALDAIDRIVDALKDADELELEMHLNCYDRVERYREKLDIRQLDISMARMKRTADEIYKKAIKTPHELTNLGESPIVFACNPYINMEARNYENPDLNFARSLGEHMGCEHYQFSSDPKLAEIRSLCKAASEASGIVFASYNAHINLGQMKLYEHLKRLNKPMVFFALRNPYDLNMDAKQDNIAKIALYEHSQRAVDRAIAILDRIEDEE